MDYLIVNRKYSSERGRWNMPSQEERVLAAVLYVASFFTIFIGPLIIWLIKKEDSAFIDYHGKEYFNFLISYTVYTVVSIILMIVLVGVLTIWLVGVYVFIFTIIAAVKAYEGETYRIPLVFRIIR